MLKAIRIFLVLYIMFCPAIVHAQNVTIIESQQTFGHTMDTVWRYISGTLGFTGAIFPQNTLDSTAFFSNTDILIVASGVNTLSPNQVQNIEQFVLQGGDVYLQTEYLQSYTTTQAFASIVNNLGGGFNWIADIGGDLNPMNVMGSFATTPNPVLPLGYYWYGVSGNACSNVDPFLEYQGQYFGFAFCPGTPGIGKIVTTTDQDWIRTATPNDINLGTNILSFLADTAASCSSVGFPLLNLGADTILCAGDSITLHAGAGFNSYLWQNGSTDSVITVSGAGNYFVTVTTPCNTYIDTVVVSTIPCNAVPVVMLASSDTIFCDKKCLDFTDLSTNNPTSWYWNFPGGLPAFSTMQNPVNICYNAYGNFDITLIVCNAAGCDTLFLPSFIIEYQLPAQPVISQSNDTLYATPAYSYAWYDASNPGVIISTDSFYASSSGGSYFVIISDSLGCQNSSGIYTAAGIYLSQAGSLPVQVFPNPATDYLQINWPFEPGVETTIRLLTLIGQEMETTHFIKNEGFLHVENYANGIYLVQVINKSGTGNALITIRH